MGTIDQQRVIQKMDEYMSRRDYDGAERHLLYWLEEAKYLSDQRGELMVRGELIGHFRKTGNREGAFHQADEALRLIRELDYDGTIASGTTYVNIATAYDAFGEEEKSLQMFEKAKEVYENAPSVSPELLGGLYNNLGLTLVSLGREEEAMGYYEKAMAQMEKVAGGHLEIAITCLNMADAWQQMLGPEEAEKHTEPLLDRAYELLQDDSHVDQGYYAFVLEKCAPSFEYYGYFLAAEEFSRRAREIYERKG